MCTFMGTHVNCVKPINFHIKEKVDEVGHGTITYGEVEVEDHVTDEDRQQSEGGKLGSNTFTAI